MQIESLKVFTDLAETESFTKAAQINEVTQSAVSQQIGALERHFKTALIERSRKRFRLTREGQVLYDYSKQIIQSFESLHNKVAEIKNVVSGSVRVSTVYSIGLHELPVFVKRFLKAHPTVNVHVEYRRSNQVYDDVMGNTVDLGLVAYPVADQRLQLIHLKDDPLVLVCHPNHPMAALKSIKIKALAGQKFIAFDPDIPTRRAIDKVFKDHKIEVSTVMEFDNIETVKRAVEIDAGVAILPRNTIVQEVSKQTLAEVKIEDVNLFRPIAAIHKRTKVLSPAARQFINILKT